MLTEITAQQLTIWAKGVQHNLDVQSNAGELTLEVAKACFAELPPIALGVGSRLSGSKSCK